jgi:AraC-like DNA-binding protein
MRRYLHSFATALDRESAAVVQNSGGKMSYDILSDVLRHVRLRGALYYRVGGSSMWAAEAPPSSDIAATVMPEVEHVMEYHVVTRGECWGAIVGEAPVRLQTGDILLFPHGDPHVMSSAPGMRASPDVTDQFTQKTGQLPFTLAHEGLDGPKQVSGVEDYGTTLVCGFLGCDLRPFNPLIARLPRLLHLRAGKDQAWIEQFIKHAVEESNAKRPGGEVMLERMSEMMFIDAVRRYVDSLPPDSTGWLAGLRDQYIGKTLRLLHEQPGAPWTIDGLGRLVGLSRSTLHERFVAFIGQPPMQYLANWRMQIAASFLRDSNATVATIAMEVGYESEAAFSRAFKRLVGLPPAAWRRRQGRRDSTVSVSTKGRMQLFEQRPA